MEGEQKAHYFIQSDLPNGIEWTHSICISFISLMILTVKIMLRVIQNLIKSRCESMMSDAQFVFGELPLETHYRPQTD